MVVNCYKSLQIIIFFTREVKLDQNSNEKAAKRSFVFHKADAETTYTVKVTLVLNGRAIATAQKKIKAREPLQKN